MTLDLLRLELRQYRRATSDSAAAVLETQEWHELEQLEDQVWTSRFFAKIPFNWDRTVDQVNLSILYPGKILSPVYPDESWKEFVIEEIQDSSGGDGVITVTARGMIYDLAHQDRLISQEVNGQVLHSVTLRDTTANLLAFIMGFAPSIWAVGDVDAAIASTVLELTFQNATVLQAAIAVAQEAARVTQTVYEIWQVWNAGTNKYNLQFGVRGSSAPISDFRYGKNLFGLGRLQSGKQLANRVEAVDPDGRGIEDNRWEVSNVVAGVSFEMGQIGGGACPMLQDEQLTGLYIIDKAGGAHQITGCTMLANTALVLVSSTTNITDGSWVRVARNSSGDPVRYVEKPSNVIIFGVAHVTLPRERPAVTNWAHNPDLSNWPSTLPVDWSNSGTAPTKTTTPGLWKTGGASARKNAATSSLYQDQTIRMEAGQWLTYWIQLYIATFSDATSFLRFVHPESGADNDFLLDGSVAGLDQTKVWLTFSQSYQATSAGAKSCRLVIGSGTGPGDIYVDAIAMTLTPSAVPFVVGSGASLNWQDSVAYIREHGDPALQFTPRIADLTRLDNTKWPDDEIVAGGQMRLVVPDLMLDPNIPVQFWPITPRIVGLDRSRDGTVPTLSTRRPTLSSLLTAAGV